MGETDALTRYYIEKAEAAWAFGADGIPPMPPQMPFPESWDDCWDWLYSDDDKALDYRAGIGREAVNNLRAEVGDADPTPWPLRGHPLTDILDVAFAFFLADDPSLAVRGHFRKAQEDLLTAAQFVEYLRSLLECLDEEQEAVYDACDTLDARVDELMDLAGVRVFPLAPERPASPIHFCPLGRIFEGRLLALAGPKNGTKNGKPP